jgi:hypothetical protein
LETVVQRDPKNPLDHLIGGTVGTIALLIVLASVLPGLFGYIVALVTLAMIARLVWFYTNRF